MFFFHRHFYCEFFKNKIALLKVLLAHCIHLKTIIKKLCNFISFFKFNSFNLNKIILIFNKFKIILNIIINIYIYYKISNNSICSIIIYYPLLLL